VRAKRAIPAVIWICLLGAGQAPAQEEALLAPAEAQRLLERAVQLIESTMITVPGLARAAEPILEDARQSLQDLRTGPSPQHAGHTYRLLTDIRAYQALAYSLPKPYPFAAEAGRQFAELREAAERIETHFRALLDRTEALLRAPDRDNVARYAEANAKLPPPQPGRPRVVFLGDSITEGWRLNEYFPEQDFINRGISGQITGQMLGRMKADVLDLKPAAVLVLGGTNDIARGVPLKIIEDNLAMISELAAGRGVKVILASVLPVHNYHKDRDPRFERTRQRPLKTILELNDWIREFAKRGGHIYLDYYSAMVDASGYLREDLADDGLHPNAAGYRVMAPLAGAAISRAVAPAQGPAPRRRRFPF
jgi:lysophospholipase L1-like esterase